MKLSPIPLNMRDTLEQMFEPSVLFRYSFDEMEYTQPDTTDIAFTDLVFTGITSRRRLQAEGA